MQRVLEFIKKHQKTFDNVLFSLVAFAIPFTIIAIIFTQLNFTPFGDKSSTMMTLDMQSQYIVFMRYYKEVLAGRQSAIYTGGKVFGGDFMSIFSYYLASPFNLFLVFVKSADIPAFFAVTSMIKMSLAGVFSYLCLSLTVKKPSPIFLVSAIGYSLISYSFIYMYNFMWLDGVMILPLIVLGLNFLYEEKGRWVYPLALGYSLMTSWYIGAMIAIFSIVYYIYKLGSEAKNKQDLLKYTARFAIFSLIGGLLVSPFWLTAFMHLSGTKGSIAIPDNKTMSISTFFAGFIENHYLTYGDIARNQCFFTMFVGSVVLVFFQLYFFNKSYTRRQRIAAIILPLFYFAGMMSRSLNALYHGGREPTWFPGRYSFILGFVVCYFAGLTLHDIKKVWKPGFALPIASLLIVFIIFKVVPADLGYYHEFTNIALAIYLGSLAIAFGYSFFPDTSKKQIRMVVEALVSVSLITLASISSYRGAISNLKVNVDAPEYQKTEVYLEDDNMSSIFDAVKNYDSSLYRMESLFNRTGSTNTINNNPMFFGYNGLSHFSSNEKQAVQDYFNKIGLQYNGFFEKYDGGSTSALNSFLGVKYLIDYDKYHEYNSPIFNTNYPWVEAGITSSTEGVKYYENTLVLPYGFAFNRSNYSYVSEGKVVGDTVHWYDHFQYQNEMFKGLTDNVKDGEEKKDIFHSLNGEVTATNGATISIDEKGIKHVTGRAGSTVSITFTVPSEGYGQNLYFGEKNFSDKYSYRLDSRPIDNTTYWHKGIRGFKDTIDHKHILFVTLKEDMENSELWEELYYEDSSILNEYISEVRKQSIQNAKVGYGLTSYSIEGTFELNEDDKDFLFTLPYEGYWKVYVDGKRVPTTTKYNIFLGADLSNIKKGSHTIKAVYSDNGLVASCVISSITTATSVGMFVVYKYLQNKNKNEKLH